MSKKYSLPGKVDITQEYSETESTRILEMMYAEQNIEIIRCPNCSFPYPASIVREIKTEDSVSFCAWLITCKKCGNAFLRTETFEDIKPLLTSFLTPNTNTDPLVQFNHSDYFTSDNTPISWFGSDVVVESIPPSGLFYYSTVGPYQFSPLRVVLPKEDKEKE